MSTEHETPTRQDPHSGEPGALGEGGSPHGKRSSWMLVAAVMGAAMAAGLALVIHTWWLFWTGVAVAVASVPAGKMIRIMDDTIVWGRPPPAERQSPGGSPVLRGSRGGAGARGSAAERPER